VPARLLVTGGEWPAGLGLARGLAAAGHVVIAAVSDPKAPVRLSRAVSGTVVVPDADSEPSAFVTALAQAAERVGARAVLPGTESGLLALAERPDALPASVASGAPPAPITRRATDKLALAGLAGAAGIGVPDTLIVDREDPAPPLGDISYPAVLKPTRSQVELPDGRRLRSNTVCVRSEGEAAAALRALPAGSALLQPFLAGPVVTVNGTAWEGETLVTVHQAAERLWPLDCGVLAAARTVHPDARLEECSQRLLREVGWSGLFNLQFVVHDGEPLLIDLNPRAYYSLALAIAAGANLPAVWAARLLGEEGPPPVAASVGVRFRGELEDARSLVRLLHSGQLRAAWRGARPARGRVHALGARGDWRPLLQGAATLAGAALQRAPDKLRGSRLNGRPSGRRSY
jgi:predicted ATP-grasp superfamily ATP-dependent carboligase